jgi:hypothetical protein
MKKCPTCKLNKDNSEFYPFKDKPHGHCKLCHRIHSRKHQLKRTYNMTVEDYDSLAKKQNFLCAICNLPGHTNNRQKYPLYVDHDHNTGRIRGLLCADCNTLLGRFDKYKQLYNKMVKYISE